VHTRGEQQSLSVWQAPHAPLTQAVAFAHVPHLPLREGPEALPASGAGGAPPASIAGATPPASTAARAIIESVDRMQGHT
jgi:hypothetical protein